MAKVGGKRPGAGRPKGAKDKVTREAGAALSALARTYTKVALDALVRIAKKGESETARVAAAEAILNRGYGRPPQAVLHSGANGGPIPFVDLTKLSDAQLAQLETILAQAAVAGADQDGAR